MKINKILIIFFLTLFTSPVISVEQTFNQWLIEFEKYALKNNISKETYNKTMTKVIFLPKVIKYDRYQPEFYEDTKTYISKRTSKKKVSKGINFYKDNDELINSIESKYKRKDDIWYSPKWDIEVKDRQLASAPIHSREGQDYIDSMNAAGNYAFANRSALTQRLRKVLREILGSDSNLDVIYDVSHNIAKIEDHKIHKKNCKCCVHRKGATRALGGDHIELSERFRGIGQPVLVPGDMGTASWILAGPKKGSNDAFSSSCHGAGRKMSRTAARNNIDSMKLKTELEERGIFVHSKTPNILSEEAPDAYKDVNEVVKLTQEAELARPVARLRPLAVIKG